MQLLLNSGANVNKMGGEYCTALQAAASKDSETVVCLLLNSGADVNTLGGEYDTSL